MSTDTITAVSPELTGDYVVDQAHTRIGFVARHAMITKVRGSFNEFEGRGHFDAADPAKSSVEVTIKAASVDTRNEDRDRHLRSNDFLDMEKYPEIRFASTSVEPAGDSVYRVSGDLTIKDVTKPVGIDFEFTGAVTDPFGNERAGFEGSTTINRKDWGVSFNAPLETGGVLVGENVTLEFEVAAIKQTG